MKSEKEILDALYTLKNVCTENEGNCRKCTLQNDEKTCGVLRRSVGYEYENLMDWNLKNYEPTRLILS